MTEQAGLLQRYDAVMMNAFGTPKRAFSHGEGIHLWDVDGNRYTDLLAGIAVNSLGHAHPAVTSAISAQLSTLGHVSNFFATEARSSSTITVPASLAADFDILSVGTWRSMTRAPAARIVAAGSTKVSP